MRLPLYATLGFLGNYLTHFDTFQTYICFNFDVSVAQKNVIYRINSNKRIKATTNQTVIAKTLLTFPHNNSIYSTMEKLHIPTTIIYSHHKAVI